MCGIAVAIDWNDAGAAARRLMEGIRHRGDVSDPIAEPRPRTAMATRRLRIVDAARGEQPKASFDGRLLVSMNGEIYNHAELRRELEAQGVPFASACDTEVLANALQAWGPRALKRLKGMYAFVALDIASGAFLAARDPFGVKPLYLIQSGTGFLFCSEIAPLLDAAPEGEVMLLPPGYLLTRDLCSRFYTLPAPVTRGVSVPEALDRILDEAVASRLPDSLPAAALFSGGIDSTLLMHYARRHRPDMPAYFIGGRDAPDHTYARAYADRAGLDLREVAFEAGRAETLPLLAEIAVAVESFEPSVVRPALYSWLIARRIHGDGFRVALCGEGADELFAGYPPLEHAFDASEALGRHVQEQSLSLMHRANLQRLDRCGMRFAVEIREPFLDLELVNHAMGLDAAALLRRVDGLPRGKQPLRDIYDLYPGKLPTAIRDRRKIPFDEGAGLARQDDGWTALFEDAVSDADFAEGKRAFAAFALKSKEEFFYLNALARRMDVNRVPHLTGRIQLTVPADAMPDAMKKLASPA